MKKLIINANNFTFHGTISSENLINGEEIKKTLFLGHPVVPTSAIASVIFLLAFGGYAFEGNLFHFAERGLCI